MNYFREMVSEAGKLFVKPAASMTTGGFPRGKLMFRAQPFWQQLREDHIAGGGIEFKMGMDDGINFAKLKTKVEVEPDSSYAQSCVKVVSDSSCKGDTDAVSSVLREFVASNDTSQISYIFQSCFVTQKAASASVCEACKLNQIEALKLLLKAGSLPTSKLSGKPALHFAVENGSEDAALMLITSELNAEEIMATDNYGKNVFEVAESLDMEPMMRRLKTAIDKSNGGIQHTSSTEENVKK